MDAPIVSVDLAEVLAAQEVGAEVFLPFAIRCLQSGNPLLTEAVLSVRVFPRQGAERFESLEVRWPAAAIAAQPPALQPHIVTEWGALGVACAALYALGDGLRLTDVATEGDRFDYWVGDGFQEWGLEVNGTERGDLAERHGDKVAQLLSNPYGVDGFVVAVRFASQEAWFTFHRVGVGRQVR